MRILHTADWHLGHRLGRLDRGEDMRKAVERIAALCEEHAADVLLVCGDLFDEVTRSDVLRHSVEHLGKTFRPFFARGGTLLAITGNHDKEHLAHVIQQSMRLAAPADTRPGGQLTPGRFHLFTGPTFFRLACVQFVMMPWPTAARYLDEQGQRFGSSEEKNRALRTAFTRRLRSIFDHPDYDQSLPTVLAAHITTRGAQVRPGFTLTEIEGPVLDDAELPTGLAYVGLGDVHRPQCLMNLSHVRYAGSIERLDLGEADDEKGVVLVEVHPAEGRRGEPRWLPLEATPIRRVVIDDPPTQMPLLAAEHPDRERVLANLHLTYQPGRDNLNELLAELEKLFPRWYDRHWQVAGRAAGEAADAGGEDGAADPARVASTIHVYLADRLAGHPDRDELLALAATLLAEEE